MEELKQFSIDVDLIPAIAEEIRAIIADENEAKFKEAEAMERRLTEIEKKIKRLRQRFILEEEITREEYNEFAQILTQEKEQILKEIQHTRRNTSNILNKVEDCLEIGANLDVLWKNGDYRDKQRLQKIAFPEGMRYSKEKDVVLTNRVNELFRVSSEISQVLSENRGPVRGQKQRVFTSLQGGGIKPSPAPPAHTKYAPAKYAPPESAAYP